MKRFVSILALVFCLTTGMAQTYKMVVRVNNGTAMGFPDGKIAIPVDNISEVTFEEINEDVIPEGTTPVTFQFKDYAAITRSPMRKAPALTARKYGVFGCYKNGEPLSLDNLSANLINNQEVKFVGDRWEYAPIKYWPQKEEGSNYASFFAYSPYANGNGFVSVNSASSEPVIEYNSINPMDDAGDLLYGSKINTTKNDNNGCVTIDSKHALARLNLKAVSAIDQISSGNNTTDTKTKVTIKSIKISGQIPSKGSFDLYRQQWKNLSTETQTYTLEGDNLAADLRDAGNTLAANQPEGVTSTSKPIGVSPYLFIPTDGETEITITVNYFVTTDDAHLTNGYSRVENVISKPLNLNFNAGYNYDLKIILGLTSVKCDVSTSSSWENNDIIF